MKNKKIDKVNVTQDLAFLILLPALAAAAVWALKLDFLVSTILFFGLPALYLTLKGEHKVKRTLVFSVCFTIAGVYTDYMAERDLAWTEKSSVLSFRIGGVVPVESIVWFFMMTYLIISFYEHFFDRVPHKIAGQRMKLLYIVLTLSSVVFFLPLAVHRALPVVTFFYLKLGLVLGVLPLTAFIIEFPRFLSRFLKIAPYFLALSLLNEFIGLHNHHWIFPGKHFVGWISLGTFRFPYEELIFWMVMFSSIVIVYFELFDDNRLKLRTLKFSQARLHSSSK